MLWPNRSLSPAGATVFLGLASVLLLVPLLPFLGTGMLWALAPFPLAVLALTARLFERNFEDGKLVEELEVWPELIVVERKNPGAPAQIWSARPCWTSVQLRSNGPVENYLTLRGNGREIELGAFLSPGERITLFEELQRVLARVNSGNPVPPR